MLSKASLWIENSSSSWYVFLIEKHVFLWGCTLCCGYKAVSLLPRDATYPWLGIFIEALVFKIPDGNANAGFVVEGSDIWWYTGYPGWFCWCGTYPVPHVPVVCTAEGGFIFIGGCCEATLPGPLSVLEFINVTYTDWRLRSLRS